MGSPIDSAVAAMQAAQQHVNASTALANAAQMGQPWSGQLVMFLSLGVLTFTTLVLGLAALLLWRSAASALHILRVLGIISIIGLSTLLLVVGYSNEQLTPIVGLFGAIAGYLLGKDSATSEGAVHAEDRPSTYVK